MVKYNTASCKTQCTSGIWTLIIAATHKDQQTGNIYILTTYKKTKTKTTVYTCVGLVQYSGNGLQRTEYIGR